MRTNVKCINSYAHKHQLKRYSVFRQNPIFPKDQNMKKYQHFIDAYTYSISVVNLCPHLAKTGMTRLISMMIRVFLDYICISS